MRIQERVRDKVAEANIEQLARVLALNFKDCVVFKGNFAIAKRFADETLTARELSFDVVGEGNVTNILCTVKEWAESLVATEAYKRYEIETTVFGEEVITLYGTKAYTVEVRIHATKIDTSYVLFDIYGKRLKFATAEKLLAERIFSWINLPETEEEQIILTLCDIQTIRLITKINFIKLREELNKFRKFMLIDKKPLSAKTLASCKRRYVELCGVEGATEADVDKTKSEFDAILHASVFSIEQVLNPEPDKTAKDYRYDWRDESKYATLVLIEKIFFENMTGLVHPICALAWYGLLNDYFGFVALATNEDIDMRCGRVMWWHMDTELLDTGNYVSPMRDWNNIYHPTKERALVDSVRMIDDVSEAYVEEAFSRLDRALDEKELWKLYEVADFYGVPRDVITYWIGEGIDRRKFDAIYGKC